MNFKQIQQLIKFVSKTDVNEVTIENKDFKINIKGKSFYDGKSPKVVQESLIPRQAQQTIAQPDLVPVVNTDPQLVTQPETPSNLVTIKSPIIGTFYRKPSPDKDLSLIHI